MELSSSYIIFFEHESSFYHFMTLSFCNSCVLLPIFTDIVYPWRWPLSPRGVLSLQI